MMSKKKMPSHAELLGGKKEAEKSKAKHKTTTIEHHGDGSHTVRHVPHESGPEISYAARGLDEVHDGLEEHMGEPNHDEEVKK